MERIGVCVVFVAATMPHCYYVVLALYIILYLFQYSDKFRSRLHLVLMLTSRTML